jgi:DNA-binding protein H-NS
LSAADIAGKAPPALRKPEGRKVEPKYRNPETGETWSGRGLQPKWLKAALADGRKITDFAL